MDILKVGEDSQVTGQIFEHMTYCVGKTVVINLLQFKCEHKLVPQIYEQK
jgi:hypothetical protein